MADYFTADTDASIKRYLEADTHEKKNEIFNVEIKPAFMKLIESLINVYKFYTIGDVDSLKMEALAHLYEILPKFDPARGKKSFSYFNVVGKNWFIQKVKEKEGKARSHDDPKFNIDHELLKNDSRYALNHFEEEIIEKEMWVSFYKETEKWRTVLTKKNERQVLEAIIYLMKNAESISNYNKKAVYIYLHNLTGLNIKQVVLNLKKIKQLYLKFKEDFSSGNGGFTDSEC